MDPNVMFQERVLEKMRKRIQQSKKKRPGYGEILDFYQRVRESQESVKVSLKIDPIRLKKEWKELLAKEGFPLLQREDFPLDMKASTTLFQSLCEIGKEANPHMAEQVKKIEDTIQEKRIDLKELLKQGMKEERVEGIGERLE